MTFTASESGTYYARVSGDRNETGSYTLRVTDVTQQEAVFVPGPPETELETFPGQSTPGAGGRDNVSEPVNMDLPADTNTTGEVDVGGSVTGNLSTRQDRDWFRVALEEGQTYQIDLEGKDTDRGTTEDPLLQGIFDWNGVLIPCTMNDDGPDGTVNSQVIFTSTGNESHYISAGAISGAGTYTLSVRAIVTPGFVEDDMDLPGNATTTGTVEVDGFGARGTISEPRRLQSQHYFDSDWFKVVLEEGQTYQIDLQGGILIAPGTFYDPGLTLHLPEIIAIYDADSNSLDYTSDSEGSGPGDAARVEFTPTADGTYYISAGGVSFETGGYELTVSDITGTENSDPHTADLSTEGLIVLGFGNWATGKIDFYQDVDWFKVGLTAGKEYRVDLEGRATGRGSLSDPFLRGIFDAEGNWISGTGDDDGGEGYNSHVTFTPDEDGNYYVAAGAFGYFEGTYRLSVAELPDVM